MEGEALRRRRMHGLAVPSITHALLIAAKCFFQPTFELAEEETEISAGRLLEKFDNARTEILTRVINRTG